MGVHVGFVVDKVVDSGTGFSPNAVVFPSVIFPPVLHVHYHPQLVHILFVLCRFDPIPRHGLPVLGASRTHSFRHMARGRIPLDE
jgi:hypothetical protein